MGIPFQIILGLGGLVLVLILLWVADVIAKGGFGGKTKKAKKEFSEQKEEKNENKMSDEQIKSDIVPIEFTAANSNLSDDLSKLIENTKEQEPAPKERILSSRLSTTGRIREYYENKWQCENPAHNHGAEHAFHPIAIDDDEQMHITQEDVKKLMVMKDLFDKH